VNKFAQLKKACIFVPTITLKTNTMYKIYFTRLHKGTELVTNVTFLNADNIKEATLYALKTFGDNLIEVIER